MFEQVATVSPGQQYRLEVASHSALAKWVACDDQYPYGVAYNVWGPLPSYLPNYDGTFRFNSTLSALGPTATALAVRKAAAPLTQTPAARTQIALAQQTSIPFTATQRALATRAAALGLPPEVANQLAILSEQSFLTTFELQPGQSLRLIVGIIECCYLIKPVTIQARWSISPADGAKIDPNTGLITVDSSTPHGRGYTVTATLGDTAYTLVTKVTVYTPQGNPLVGVWQEDAQFTCDGSKEVQPRARIGELVFRAEGRFLLTWYPFEVYVDYEGTYRHDLKSGALTLSPQGGNYMPRRTDLSGTARLDAQGRLVLSDMWLGAPPDSDSVTPNCGHRFVRRPSDRW
jgi:hypothetical protein